MTKKTKILAPNESPLTFSLECLVLIAMIYAAFHASGAPLYVLIAAIIVHGVPILFALIVIAFLKLKRSTR